MPHRLVMIDNKIDMAPEELEFRYTSRPTQYDIEQLLTKIRPGGFEPPTLGSEVRCSIQLSYGRISENVEGL